MARRKVKQRKKSAAKRKPVKRKVSKRTAAKRKPAAKRKAPKRKPVKRGALARLFTPAPEREEGTMVLSAREVLGDIEEALALDKLKDAWPFGK